MRHLFKAAVTAAATATIILATSNIALAHPSQAWGSCQAGVSFEAHDYPSNGPSTVNVVIDGQQIRDYPRTFVGSVSSTIDNWDKTVPHTWVVTFDRFDGTEGDRVHVGEFGACEQPTTTTDRPTPTTEDRPEQPTTTTIETRPTTTLSTIEERPTTTTAAPTTTAPTATTVNPTTTTSAPTPTSTSPTATSTPTPTTQPPPVLPETGTSSSILWAGLIVATMGAVLLIARRKVGTQ